MSQLGVDVQEITGQLIGGPDDGNMVTGSTRIIPIINTVEMWLDGPSGTCTKIVTLGDYVWQEDKGYFSWQLRYSSVV